MLVTSGMRLSGLAIALLAMSFPAGAADTYRPECFAPAPDNTKTIQYPAKKPPFKIALVNGYVGNDWRLTTILSAKAWGARPDNKAKLADFKVISVGNDSAAQIAAIDNFIAAGYDGIVINAVNPSAFDPVIKRAQRAGTVIVPYDNVLDTDKIVQINEDQFELGKIKAEAVVEGIKAAKGEVKGQVLEASGLPGNGVMVQEGTIGALTAMANAHHAVVPIGSDAGNGARMIIAEQKYPGITAAQAPAMSAIALEATVALLEGKTLPQKVFLPIPQKKNSELVAGKDFFPDLPKNFYTTTGYPQCFPVFKPEEILSQSKD
jgi:ribose transport system substrate-binding protein